MIRFFEYNWQVREEWFSWCNQLTTDELIENRVGGVRSILYTLFHIIDVEYSWIRGIRGEEEIVFQFTEYNTLEKVKSLSDTLRNEVVVSLKAILKESNDELVTVPWDKNAYTKDAILHHIIIHEIHHIGQLSVWARQLEQSPIPASFLDRKL